ncbi:MAG: hypothetical protein JKX80_00725 [Candidatus Pacebacteria bacterium]|nr:hypothetical protein [Candidatus Paceibacterota bacterium]
MKNITIAIVALVIGIIGTVLVTNSPKESAPTIAQESEISSENPYERLPVIDGYYEGEKVWFIHTDVSDEGMAKRLTNMVGFNTVHVPKLTDVDASKLSKLYVFTNGLKQVGVAPWEGGPFGYQIDILDSIPGDSTYTSLRNPNLVTWSDDATPRLLTSMEELLKAKKNGELFIKPTDIVVNVPMMKWPGKYLGGESKIR